jgi:hypothetical protein
MSDLKWILTSEESYRYQMLDRLRCDCNYYLGYGGRYPKHLWAGNEKEQIEAMKLIWNSFSDEDKPEWLTWEQIIEFEKEMVKTESPEIVHGEN